MPANGRSRSKGFLRSIIDQQKSAAIQPFHQKEAAKARKNQSRVSRQNFRKKTLAMQNDVAITPNKKPSIIAF